MCKANGSVESERIVIASDECALMRVGVEDQIDATSVSNRDPSGLRADARDQNLRSLGCSGDRSSQFGVIGCAIQCGSSWSSEPSAPSEPADGELVDSSWATP